MKLSPRVGPSPILWNQSELPKELPGPLNLLVLLLSRQSACFTLPPSLSFVLISSKAKEGLFLSLLRSLSPFLSTLPPLQSAFHAGEALSSGSTRKRTRNGHLGPVTPRLLCIFILYRTGSTSQKRCIKRCMEGLYLTPRLLFCT